MKRTGRWIFNALAAISLLLLIATIAACVASYWREDYARWNRSRISLELNSHFGALQFIFRNSDVEFDQLFRDPFIVPARGLPENFGQIRQRLLIHWASNRELVGLKQLPIENGESIQTFELIEGKVVIVSIPYWIFALVQLAFPAIWLRKAMKNRNLKLIGHCSSCGYDLRASKDRCPECGTLFFAATP